MKISFSTDAWMPPVPKKNSSPPQTAERSLKTPLVSVIDCRARCSWICWNRLDVEAHPVGDALVQVDHRTLRLARLATIGAIFVAGDARGLQSHLEDLGTDLGVVVIQEVLAVLLAQLLPELDHRQGLMVEGLGGMNVMGVVLAQHRHLFVRQRHAHGEWQVFHAVEAHVELQCLERGHLRLVVEVVDLEQVDLVDEPVGREDGVGELVLVVARLDDLHRLLVQVGMGRLALHLAEQVQHRVVEACVVEADHLCADAAQARAARATTGRGHLATG